MLDRVVVDTGPAVGAAGSATATGYGPWVAGKVLAVYVTYGDSPPATTDFTLSDEADPAGEAIVSLTNTNTSQKLYPRRLLETNDGTDITYNGTQKVYAEYVVAGRLKAVIAQANAADYVRAVVWMER